MKVAWILGEDTKCLMTKSVDAVCKHTAANWTSGKQFLFNCNFAHLSPALYTQMPRKQTHTLSFFLSLLSSACISAIFFRTGISLEKILLFQHSWLSFLYVRQNSHACLLLACLFTLFLWHFWLIHEKRKT